MTVKIAVVIVITFAVIAPLAGCGKDSNTTTLETTTTKPGTTADPKVDGPSKESLDAAVATFTKLGFKEDQARCLVDELSKVSSDLDTSKLAENQTAIDKLMARCGISTDSGATTKPPG